MLDIKETVRSSAANLDLDQLLRQPVTELLGVSATASTALSHVGIKTIFDLGTSSVFASARAVLTSGVSGSKFSQYGLVPGDLVSDIAEFSSISDIPDLPIASLRILPSAASAELASSLDVKSIRDFALWPPQQAAARIVGESFGSDLSAEDLQTEELRPRTGQYPTERVYYDTLVMLQLLPPSSGQVANQKSLGSPISLKAAIDGSGMSTPAIGAMLTFSQSWYSQGVTLGHLLHSLALAPGEATRVAVIDWSRRTRAATSESISESEALDSSTEHARALSEVQNAVASDFQAGGSQSSSTSGSESYSTAQTVGTGLAESVLVSADETNTGQGASTKAEAQSSGWSLGNRSVLGTLTQNVNDRTEQHSASVRNRRATAVREVSQSEHEQVSTRIVANYNHMHALTVQYYEVVQLYRTEARLHRADRCLFVPIEMPDFAGADGKQFVERFRGALAAAALTRRVRSLLLDTTPAVAVVPSSPMRLPWQAGTANAGVWDINAMSAAAAAVDRPIMRIGSTSLYLPDETVLSRVIYNGFRARGGGTAIGGSLGSGQSTYASYDAPAGTLLREIGQFSVTLAPEVPIDHPSITAVCSYYGREFSLPPIPVALSTASPGVTAFTVRSEAPDREHELLDHLQSHRDYYGQAILRSFDSATLTLILSNLTWNGKALIDTVEPRPLRVAGNYLVLRAPVSGEELSGVTINNQPVTWTNYLKDRGLDLERPTDQRLIPIATGGVFAEAVLGRANAAEKLDVTRFWHWQDSPIPLTPPEIQPVATGSRATTDELKPGQLSSPVLNIVNPTALPAPDSMSTVLNALTALNFRDMSGLAGTQSLVKTGMEQTLQAATDAGQIASANLRAEAQKAVAMGQIAADIVKSIFGGKAGGGSGNVQGISAEGARINHGRSMDERGVPTTTSGATPGPSSGSGSTRSDSPGGGPTSPSYVPGGSSSGTSALPPGPGFSREAAYADQAALNFSPDAAGAITAQYQPVTSPDFQLASFVAESPSKSATKLPSKVGNAAEQAWESLAPIVPRNTAACAAGIKNLGTLLCVHDAETKIDLRDYGGYTNANAWVLVHTVSDLIEAIRSYVGNCNLIGGLHIEAHGGWSGDGGFRLGNDTNGNGHIEGGEADDFVSDASQAAKFGAIIKNALAPNAFISVASCGSAGSNNGFIKTLQSATGAIVIGTPSKCRSGGSWFSGAWWEADKGRVQINKDGTTKVDASDDGTGIWMPF